MRLKVILAICVIGILTACGNTEPVQTVEEEIEEVEEDEEDEPEEEEATFVKTGKHKYTLYLDCPDNSSEALPETLSDVQGTIIKQDSKTFGISPELINAILMYGLQTDISNPTQANIEPYLDTLTDYTVFSSMTFPSSLDEARILEQGQVMFTYDSSKYHDSLAGNLDAWVILIDHLDSLQTSSRVCCAVLKDALSNCNGNLTCALARYNIGPDNWDKLMEECMDATDLSAEEIYANYDSSFVLRYDTLGLGDPEFVPGVLQYIGSDPIVIRYADESGNIYDDTYTLVRP